MKLGATSVGHSTELVCETFLREIAVKYGALSEAINS